MILLYILFFAILILLLIAIINKFLNKTKNGEDFCNQYDMTKKITRIGNRQLEPLEFINKIDQSGISRCMEECDGTCLPYGYTGYAYCFPSKDNSSLYIQTK